MSESEIGGEDCERQAKAISGAVIDIAIADGFCYFVVNAINRDDQVGESLMDLICIESFSV